MVQWLISPSTYVPGIHKQYPTQGMNVNHITLALVSTETNREVFLKVFKGNIKRQLGSIPR